MPPLLRPIILALLLVILGSGLAPLRAEEPVEVEVTGVEGELLANVEAALTPPDSLIRDGVVDRPWLEHYAAGAPAAARKALEPFGYYRATAEAALSGSAEEGFLLSVSVVPGTPVIVSEVTVAVAGPGAAEEQVKGAVAAFPLRKGEPLRHNSYEAGKEEILSRARALGYLDARFLRHEIRVSPAAGTARLDLLLETGERYRFGEVIFEGAPLYPDDLLRRYLAFRTGAPFSFDRLGRTHANLAGSGYFREVTVLPLREEAAAYAVPVRVTLTPAPNRTLRPGLGYGTNTGFRGSLSYKELNLFRRGHVLTVEGTAAENFQGVAAGYLMPSPTSLRSVTGLQANFQREEVTSYLSSLVAVEASRTESLGRGLLATLFLRFQYEEFTAGQERSSARLVMPGLRLSGRRLDSVSRPTSGHDFSLELRGTHQALGSDTGFIQGVAEGAYLLPLPWRLTLASRAKVGATWQNDPLTQLPASLRFYAGGDTSVRGYAYKSLGPTNPLGEVVGGRNLLQGSVELERALFDSWGVSLFYDAGNAFDSFGDIRLYQGAGMGLHYYTRVGGLNLSLARQLDVPDPGFRVHFTIGFQP